MRVRLRWAGWLVSLLLGAAGCRVACAQTTVVDDVVKRADGTAAQGTVLISWPTFTSASGTTVAKGSTAVTLTAAGGLHVVLTANAGAVPVGMYYTAVYQLQGGSVSREYWMIPVSSSSVSLQTVRASVLPTAVAMQTATKQYVDQAIAHASTGTTGDYVLKAGDTMTGPLVLPNDPTATLQASTKGYVDTNVTQLQAGLGQKVSTAPLASQAVVQPAGTGLTVNRLNDVLRVDAFKSGTVAADGVSNTLAQSDCVNGCDAVISRSYLSYDRFSANSPDRFHGKDLRGGEERDLYVNPHNTQEPGIDTAKKITLYASEPASDVKANTGSPAPSSFGLFIEHYALAGGNNLFPQNLGIPLPYFKSNYSALRVEGFYHTQGQHILDNQATHCYGVGDCLAGSRFVYSSGGYRDNADEGAHAYDLVLSEDANVFRGTCSTGCTTGATQIVVAMTDGARTQGDGRFLINTTAAKVLHAGSLISGEPSASPFPAANFSGTSFPVSTLFELQDLIVPQASNMAPGTKLVSLVTSDVPSGYATSLLSAPAPNGVACVVDSPYIINFEMVPYTVVDATHVQLVLNKPHKSGATMAIGGLCGYGLEQTVDTVSGIRQVFPVIASTSATRLMYMGGAAIVGVPYLTSAYQNVQLNIASIARSNGTVTVTTTNNLPSDLNGLNLTIAGVTDTNYNGTFAVTTTAANSFTYTQSGADGTSSGGSVSLLTGGYNLYPMAEVLSVMNPSTKAIDGTFTLAPNTVAWSTNDTVELPHYYLERVGSDTTIISQTMPRPKVVQAQAIQYEGTAGPGLRGFVVRNAVADSQYLGAGGMHSLPWAGLSLEGSWTTALAMKAGGSEALRVDCNLHGCGRWNSAYNLFALQSSVGHDTIQFAPNTSTLTFGLRGTSFAMSPAGMTVGTLNATTIQMGDALVNGVARVMGTASTSGYSTPSFIAQYAASRTYMDSVGVDAGTYGTFSFRQITNGATGFTESLRSDNAGNWSTPNSFSVDGKLSVGSGVAQSGGVKHQRFSLTAVGSGAGMESTTTASWSNTFTDANYTLTCTLDSSGYGVGVLNVSNIVAGGFTITLTNVGSTASGGVANCIAMHD